jgi:hypothetical protein
MVNKMTDKELSNRHELSSFLVRNRDITYDSQALRHRFDAYIVLKRGKREIEQQMSVDVEQSGYDSGVIKLGINGEPNLPDDFHLDYDVRYQDMKYHPGNNYLEITGISRKEQSKGEEYIIHIML